MYSTPNARLWCHYLNPMVGAHEFYVSFPLRCRGGEGEGGSVYMINETTRLLQLCFY
jgi:hypothetical protein